MQKTSKHEDCQKCEICGETDWEIVYEGRIRNGAVGKLKDDGLVGQCKGCNVQRLRETSMIPDEFYMSADYREFLEQSVNSQKAYTEQDWTIPFINDAISPISIRGATIADIGCAMESRWDLEASKILDLRPMDFGEVI